MENMAASENRDGHLYTMMEVCRETGMPYQTLKFYCNQGLVPNVKRDKNNRRVFDEHDIEWVKSVGCLKRCGMSIEEMRAFLDLCLQGAPSIPARKAMLAEKRTRLEEQLAQVQPASTTSTGSRASTTTCWRGARSITAIWYRAAKASVRSSLLG